MVDILLLSLLHFFTLRKVELLYFMILVLDNAKSQFRLYLSWEKSWRLFGRMELGKHPTKWKDLTLWGGKC
jgi:hypothetical protein